MKTFILIKSQYVNDFTLAVYVNGNYVSSNTCHCEHEFEEIKGKVIYTGIGNEFKGVNDKFSRDENLIVKVTRF